MSNRTVEQVIHHVLPSGTLVFREAAARDIWQEAPDWPPDLFAVAGHLLRLSGAYSYVLPPDAVPLLAAEKRAVTLTEAEIAAWTRAADDWRTTSAVPDVVKKLWLELLSYGGAQLYQRPVGREAAAPAWWKVVYALYVIADEACDCMGYIGVTDKTVNRPLAAWAYLLFRRQVAKYAEKSPAGHARVPDLSASLGINADPDIICVQPKSRVAAVGCALRTLTHNMALLPPRGVAAVNWHRPLTDLPPEDDTAPMNILVIPFPFSIDRSWFEEVGTIRAGHPGWLDLQQRGLDDRATVLAFLIACAEEAQKRTDNRLHGIVVPEDALDWELHEKFAEHLAGMGLKIEFLVSGVSRNCGDEEGSHVLITRFDEEKGKTNKRMTSTSRSKHHRWQLDTGQARGYGLLASETAKTAGTSCGAGSLSDHDRWWEAIGLPHRVIHAHVLRDTTTMTALICEDLARSDPCHGIVRDIGPNIVISILMDGPQISGRWPQRYALALAEDPGSAVLTLTSRALVELSNQSSGHPTSWSIGLWKDGSSESVKMIVCEPGQHGVVLTLRSSKTVEQTFDGRINTDARSWRLDGQYPIVVSDGTVTKAVRGAG